MWGKEREMKLGRKWTKIRAKIASDDSSQQKEEEESDGDGDGVE